MAGNGPLARGQSAPERFHHAAVLLMLASAWCALAGSGAFTGDLLDFLALGAAGAALLWRAAAAAGLVPMPASPRWANLATAAYLLFYPADYFWISQDFLKATLHLVFFVFVIKILTSSSRRDFLLLKVVAFLALLAASIVSASLTFLICLCLFLAAAIAALSSEEILRAQAGRRFVADAASRLPARLSRLTVVSTGAVLLITAALFFFLPRTARAAFEHLLKPAQRSSGFAPEVLLGQVGEIRRQTATAFHARFLDRRLPSLKWRATALGEFDGWRWYSTRAREGRALRPAEGLVKLLDDEQLRLPGRRFTYEVLLSQTNSDWLFLAGRPEYLRLSTPVTRVVLEGRRVRGVETSEGFIEADQVICATDAVLARQLIPDLPDSVRDHVPKHAQEIYKEAWSLYYTPEHMLTVLKRAAATGVRTKSIGKLLIWFSTSVAIEKVHPLQGGVIRFRNRMDRRPNMPLFCSHVTVSRSSRNARSAIRWGRKSSR